MCGEEETEETEEEKQRRYAAILDELATWERELIQENQSKK